MKYMNVSLCNASAVPCCVNHLFEVPQRSTAVLAGYCKPAGRCCHMWGHQHLSLSPVSPKYLKSTGTQTRQTSGRSLHTPAPRLMNVSRSVLVAVSEHHLTATGWNKKKSPLSQLGELICSNTVLLFLHISALWHKNINSPLIFHDGNIAFPNFTDFCCPHIDGT